MCYDTQVSDTRPPWPSCLTIFSLPDTYLSYFAIYKDRMIPHKDYQVQSFQTTTAKQCAELCLSEFHNTNLRCRSFEMVCGRLCALSNTSAGVSSKYGYQNSVRAPGTTYYEASKGKRCKLLSRNIRSCT